MFKGQWGGVEEGCSPRRNCVVAMSNAAEKSVEETQRNPRLSYDISSQQFEWMMMGRQERTRTPQTEEEVGATSQS